MKIDPHYWQYFKNHNRLDLPTSKKKKKKLVTRTTILKCFCCFVGEIRWSDFLDANENMLLILRERNPNSYKKKIIKKSETLFLPLILKISRIFSLNLPRSTHMSKKK